MIRRIASLALLLPALAVPAFAHAMLENESPAAGALLATSPPSIFLSFSEQLEPALSDVSVTDVAGHSFAAKAPRIEGQVMMLTLEKLPPGKYHVAWRAVSVDTHRTEGGYDFTVTP